MKIYTKSGDKGETSLLGGKRVSKSHPRVEAYGNIDELNSLIGLIRSMTDDKQVTDILLKVQNNLYHIGSLVACDSCKQQDKLIHVNEADIEYLEKEIDNITNTLPALTAFIIPGGNQLVSFTHLSRCVCRRAERSVIALSERSSVENQIIIYLNRLSDYLFTLTRKLTKDAGLEEEKYK